MLRVVSQTAHARKSGCIVRITTLAAVERFRIDGSGSVEPKQVAIVSVKVFHICPLPPPAGILNNASAFGDVVEGKESVAATGQLGAAYNQTD